jgi:hypothetical protein
MVDWVKDIINQELMEQQEQQVPPVDVLHLDLMDYKERLVVMEEIGEYQVVILQIQDRVDLMEEQSQDQIIA